MEKNLGTICIIGILLTPFLPALAQEKSADEIARELNNPNNDLAKLTFKNQYRTYTGNLPNADAQDNYTLLFQPIFPFGLGSNEAGDKSVFFLRPAIPLVVDQPYFDPEQGEFRDTTDMGDWSFDSALGVTKKSGMVYAVGVFGTLPLGTSDEVTGGQLRLGPEFLLGKVSRWGALALFPYHQWDVTGWGGTQEQRDNEYSTTNAQVFVVHAAGGGWTYGTQPISSYNWKTDNWTVPVNLYVSKTIIIGRQTVKFELELNRYLEQEDAFGPEWMIGFNVTPLVDNFIEDWIR